MSIKAITPSNGSVRVRKRRRPGFEGQAGPYPAE